MKTIVVIPAFNEALVIEQVVRTACTYAAAVIVVDDGSHDNTAEVAKIAGALVVQHAQNCGGGAAMMTGIAAARFLKPDCIVLLDGDGQHDPAEIPKLITYIASDTADIVFTNRFGQKNHIPLIRRLFNGIGNVVTLLATGRYIPDSQSGFKALGPKAIATIQIHMSGFEYCTEIVRESVTHKWRIAQESISVRYSEYTLAKGQSFATGVRTAAKILLQSLMR